jgi:hypothetical protein
VNRASVKIRKQLGYRKNKKTNGLAAGMENPGVAGVRRF